MKTVFDTLIGQLLRASIPARLEEAQEYFCKRMFDKERDVLLEMANDHQKYFLDGNYAAARENLYTLLLESYEYDNELGKRLQGIMQFHDSAFPFDEQFVEAALRFLAYRRKASAAHFGKQWLEREPQDRERQKIARNLFIRNRNFGDVAPLSRILFATEENEFSPDPKGFLQVFSAQSQHEYIRGEQCHCGGWYDFHHHVSRATEGLSECHGKCGSCGEEKPFLFGVTNKTFWKLLFGKETDPSKTSSV
jgi:hypothetical protein